MPAAPSELDATYFTQHVAIAEHQLVAFAVAADLLAARVRASRLRARPLTEDDIRADDGAPHDVVLVQQDAQIAWQELWRQLDDARAIVGRAGRDTAAAAMAMPTSASTVTVVDSHIQSTPAWKR